MQKIFEPDHNKNIIEIKNISFSYNEKENVLENVSLNIHKGDYISFVGNNGSGKTTLIKLIIGLLKPDEGKIKLFGTSLKDFKNWQKIGYVPQQVSNFEKGFPVNVFETVLMGRYAKQKIFQRTNQEDLRAVEIALQNAGIWELKDRLIGDLSGGQMQRVFIARAMVNNPEVIFLDEPTVGIDAESQENFYQLLQKLNKELGITLVIVSHDIKRMVQEVMHIVCVNKTLTCHMTPEDFVRESQTVNFFGKEMKVVGQHNHD